MKSFAASIASVKTSGYRTPSGCPPPIRKAEHVVDLETEAVLAASIRPADEADVDTMVDSVMEAQTNLSEAGIETKIEEAVADKGYHATDTLELADALSIRTYIPEPKRKGNGQRNWQ